MIWCDMISSDVIWYDTNENEIIEYAMARYQM